MRAAHFALGLVTWVGLVGCGAELRTRLRETEAHTAEARRNGAYRCAPRELALAESHADFARAELGYGDPVRAAAELRVAAEQSRLAFERSPRERCAPGSPAAPPPRPAAPSPPRDQDGDGIADDKDRCPSEAEDRDGFEDQDGCPDPDNDGDGIADGMDRCPDAAEDRDQFEDEDGCPDPDNDGDGIADGEDRCPREAGPRENGGCPDTDRDNDGVVDRLDRCPDAPGLGDPEGCPRYRLITVTKEKINLKQKVHFKSNRSVIERSSYPLLDEVASVLTKQTDIRVRIEGHTDSRAKRRYNLRLSQARADAVLRYLRTRGVDPARMQAVGYGPDRPIDNNRTAIGREHNRRVEFIIIQP